MSDITMETLYDGKIIVDSTARASVGRDVVSNDITSHFIEMDDRKYAVNKTVFNAVVKKFGLSYDSE